MFSQFLLFCLVGFAAQLIDGAIGMAYGVISTTVLLSIGISPAVASAAVHTAEVVTTGISGFSHVIFKNIDYKLFIRLAISGVIGSVLGAYLLTQLPTTISKPFVATYLFIMGLYILYRALREGEFLQLLKQAFTKKILKRKLPSTHARGLVPLALGGGFFDAVGGGGWGPIVTSSLLAQGTTPHYTIGTISLTEFLISMSASLIFFFTIGISHWAVVFGLIVGGSIGAPLAAYLVRRIHPRILMLMAGILIIVISIYTVIKVLTA